MVLYAVTALSFCCLLVAADTAGEWKQTPKRHCQTELWLGSAAYPPPASGQVAHYMTPEICQMAAVNTAECVSPKTISVESGPKGNCQCANATCVAEASTWLDLYVQTPPEPRPARTAGKKRGAGLDAANTGSTELDGFYSCHDMAALNLSDSWFYNWGARPDQVSSFRPGKCMGAARAAEFVPMVWGCGDEPDKKTGKRCSMPKNYQYIWEQAGVTHLLGFNEPDHVDQSNMTAFQAATDWVELQMVAAGFDPALQLVSPAPATYDNNGVSVWLDEFFGNCTSVVKECDPSTVKAIAMHDYGGDAEGLVAKAEAASKRYGGRRVWITEFADGPWHRTPQGDCRESNDAFLAKVLPLLDASDSVERYAWFASRSDPSFNIVSNLLPYDSVDTELTSTGKIYAGGKAEKPGSCPPFTPAPPAKPGTWSHMTNGNHKTCKDLFYLGSAEWPPNGAKDMSIAVCEAAAEANPACTKPRTIAVEHGGHGNCLCANATCVVEPSTYLSLYVQA